MTREIFDPGLYVNIFRVLLPDERVNVMVAPSRAHPSLRDLRDEIQRSGWQASVYRHNNQIFGYGPDMHHLRPKGFQQQALRLLDHPRWCTRLIMEGLSDHLKRSGFREKRGKGRTTLYEPEPYGNAAQGRLFVFRGYDLRAIYIWRERTPVFGLIVDICWEIRDAAGNRLNTAAMAQYSAVGEVAQIQGEYLPGNRINPEVSRLRLQNHILPFVHQNREFALPLQEEIKARLEETPMRVILGVEP